MKKTLLFVFLVVSFSAFSQNFYTLRGYVYSDKNEPIVDVHVRIFNLNTGTRTDAQGKYEIRIAEGLNRIMFTHLGYLSETVEIVADKDLAKNIMLKIDQKQIDEVVIKVKKKDYSYEVIKNMLANKDKILAQYQNYKCETYIKSTENFQAKALPKTDSITKTDTSGKLNLFECKLIRHENAQGQQKEEKIAVKRIGDQRHLFFKSITDGEFNLYKNHQRFPKIGENQITSPLSDFTFLSYKFELLKYYFEGSEKIYRIKVIPRETGNALYEGEIEIIEDIWVLKTVKLNLTKRGLLLYDAFGFEQYYTKTNDRWLPTKTIYRWKRKDTGPKKTGEALVIQSNFEFDLPLPKKFFGDEVGRTTDEAYKRDSTFWQAIRPQPLNNNELKAIEEKERLDMLMNSKNYLDSIDKIYNKITFQKILYQGIGHINRAKKTDWNFNPIIGMFDPLVVGGWRIQYGVGYSKRYENRKSVWVNTTATYGFRNNDLKGRFNVGYFYNPIKNSTVNLNIYSGFGAINGAATLNDIVRRSNFYESQTLLIRHRTELFNGFYLNTSAEMERRNDLSDFKFSSTNQLFDNNNNTVSFPESNIYKTNIGIDYTPRQLFLREPNQKIILGSRYPTFGLNIEKSFRIGQPTVLTSKFSYVSVGMRQNFNVGVFGISEYRIHAGKFLDTTQLSPMDYRYIRGGDSYFFTPSMYTYQLIPKTFTVFNWFFQSHYMHQFNGYLTSKIPLLNKTGIKEVAGAGFLYVPERKYQYSELFGGINRVFKLGQDRLRIGIYYVVAQSNTFGVRSGIKFSFEPYNQNRNTWSF